MTQTTHPEADDARTGLPNDVVSKLNDSTKSFNEERLVKLLRDTHYMGPISVGRGAKKSTGKSTGSPGSGLRRAKDGALYNATKAMRQAILDRALETDLIVEAHGGYATTPKGVEVLQQLDRCEECDTLREPKIRKWTVQISRHSTATNHALTTVCPECGGGGRGKLLDDVRSYAGANEDGALQTLKNEDDPSRIDLYGVSVDDLDDWETPGERAAQEVRERVEGAYELSTALFTLQDEYDDEWVREAAAILADDYSEESLEYAVLATMAREDEWEAPDSNVEYTELERGIPHLLPGQALRATFEIEELGREVTLVFDGRYEDDRSGLALSISTTRHAGKGMPVVKNYRCGVLGPVTGLEVVWMDEGYADYDLDNVEKAATEWERIHIKPRAVTGERSFNKIVEDEGLTAHETIGFARIARHINEERDAYVGEWLTDLAGREIEFE